MRQVRNTQQMTCDKSVVTFNLDVEGHMENWKSKEPSHNLTRISIREETQILDFVSVCRIFLLQYPLYHSIIDHNVQVKGTRKLMIRWALLGYDLSVHD